MTYGGHIGGNIGGNIALSFKHKRKKSKRKEKANPGLNGGKVSFGHSSWLLFARCLIYVRLVHLASQMSCAELLMQVAYNELANRESSFQAASLNNHLIVFCREHRNNRV